MGRAGGSRARRGRPAGHPAGDARGAVLSVYVDSSALGAILRPQAETPALVAWLESWAEPLVATHLLEAEVRRVCTRHSIEQRRATAVLARVSLVDLERTDFLSAGLIGGPHLRTLDALHLQGALRLDARAVLTYDRRLGQAAEELGFEVLAPA